MRNLLLFMLLVALFVFGSQQGGFQFFNFGGTQGKGALVSQTRDLPAFHAVESGIAADLVLHVAPESRIAFSIQENLVPLLKTEVEDGCLKIYFSESVNYQERLVIDVYAPSYDALLMMGSGNMTLQDSVRAQTFTASLSGSGNIRVRQLTSDQVDVSITGSGNVEMGGSTRGMKADISGSGECQLRELSAQSAQVQVTGSGDVSCTVQESLDAAITGSGDIEYQGSATAVKSSVTGSGEITKK